MMFRILQFIIKTFLTVLYRVEVEGAGNFAKEGPLVVCANHTFYKDLLLIGAFAPRKIFWMAKAELFRFPLISALLKGLGAFPVERGAHDREAVKKLYQILREGKPLGMFPEGTRAKSPAERPPVNRSFVSVAANSSAALQPVAIKYGGGPFGRGNLFSKICVIYGGAVALDSSKKYGRPEVETIANDVMFGIYEKIVC